ncbi:hypothetical protein Agub_g996 [Astrephomene gubernaculifera]|uniref:Uncharacterized protein n=1 Tax=Astrephomene gubernaculifera TaxID=47775 RepID=A0AAD3DHB8_9CHLO|nr:hypothetical protein Agub_g996 [Astrephomene gubernaculifera]
MNDKKQTVLAEPRLSGQLRFYLSITDGPTPAYWKHDGQRFAGKAEGDKRPGDWLTLCSASTLKLCAGATYQLSLASNQPVSIRPGSGRWCVREVDTHGNVVEAPPLLAPAAYPGAAHPHSSQPAAAGTLGFGGGDSGLSGPPGVGAGGGFPDPQALVWSPADAAEGADAGRTLHRAAWRCCLEPVAAGRRRYLCLQAHVEEFGLVTCPIQIKVYKPRDKNALQTFPLRYIQYDFREDSSYTAVLSAVNYHRY